MAHEPFVCVLVIRRDATLIHPFLYDIQYLFVLRHPKPAVLNWDDIVASRCIKACHYIAIPVISHRKLCLIAIIIWMLHANNRMHHIIFHMSHTAQQIPDLILLESQLTFIGQMLDLTAAAAAGVRTWGLHPIR